MNKRETKTTNRKAIDMSPEALDQRIRDVAQLYKLGIALKDARRIGKVEQLRRADAQSRSKSPG